MIIDFPFQAAQLDAELSNIVANSGDASKAAHAYSDIISKVDAALNSTRNAKESSGNATDLVSKKRGISILIG